MTTIAPRRPRGVAAASASSLFGDPSSLLEYEAAALETPTSPLLSLPLELWIHIFDGKVNVNDLLKLRAVCKALWRVSDRLMPHAARQMVPTHADDPRTDDPFFAEAVIAAHRLNVRTPFEVMIARDGSTSPPRGKWDAPAATEKIKAPASISIPSGSAARPQPAGGNRTSELPHRANWIIGSRRMLHLMHVQGRTWMFQGCRSCNRGECVRCQQIVEKPSRLRNAWWYQAPKHDRHFEYYSNAILASDARFCKPCRAVERE